MDGLSETIQRVANSSRPPGTERASTVPTAREIMTTRLITVEPTDTVREAVRRLLKHRISGMPVVRERRRLVGMLSEADCVRVLCGESFHRDGLAALRVADLMSTALHWIEPELDLYSIAQRLLSSNLRRIPVVQRGTLLGQISRCDVLRVIDRM